MKLIFASDMSLNCFRSFPGKEAVKNCVKDVRAKFEKYDMSMINLENIMGKREEGEPIDKSGPNLISPDEFFEYVKELKPTVVGLANNHTGDFGAPAITHTIAMIENIGAGHVGVGLNTDEAYVPFYFEKGNIKVGIIAVCENEFGTASDNFPGSAGYSLGRVTKGINDIKSNGALPIVYFHGGNEYNPFPSPGKVELYRHFIDIGASAVIAMHTHCPQGYEYYNGKPIVYSMGNFFFPKHKGEVGFDIPQWFYGYMTEMNIDSKKRITINPIPYRFDFDRIIFLKGEKKKNFLDYLNKISLVIKDGKEIGKYFDGWTYFWGKAYSTSMINVSNDSFNGDKTTIKQLRNVLTCEAHNELIKNYIVMCFEDRYDAAKEYHDKITELQNTVF